MRRFWQGLVWGSLIGTLLASIMGTTNRPQKKPLVETSTEDIKATTNNLMRQARRARKRLMKKLD